MRYLIAIAAACAVVFTPAISSGQGPSTATAQKQVERTRIAKTIEITPSKQTAPKGSKLTTPVAAQVIAPAMPAIDPQAKPSEPRNAPVAAKATPVTVAPEAIDNGSTKR